LCIGLTILSVSVPSRLLSIDPPRNPHGACLALCVLREKEAANVLVPKSPKILAIHRANSLRKYLHDLLRDGPRFYQ
jgi:hypothetical protein